MQFQSYSFQFQNKQYLIVVDFYLKYFEVELLRRSPTSHFMPDLGYLRKSIVTMALNAPTREMCLVDLMSLKSLQKNRNFDLFPIYRNIRSQMGRWKELYRRQSEFLGNRIWIIRIHLKDY